MVEDEPRAQFRHQDELHHDLLLDEAATDFGRSSSWGWAGARRSGTTAHPIHEDIKAKPVLEERFVVTIRVDRIGNVAEHVSISSWE